MHNQPDLSATAHLDDAVYYTLAQ